MDNTPAQPKAPVRRSKTIAKVWPDNCTGCEACIAVAPWDDCLFKTDHDPNKPFGMIVVEVNKDKCTGCTLCMKICPWDAITMVPRPTA
jgi:ferredoxin